MSRWVTIAGLTAATFCAVGAVAVWWYSDVIADEQAASIEYAESQVREVFYHWREEAEAPANTWQVQVADGWDGPIGDTDVQPQMLPLAEPAIEDGTSTEEFDFLGDKWFSYAVHVGQGEVIVAIIDRAPQDNAIRSAAWTAALVTLASACAAAGAAIWWTGREAPAVRQAHG
ncbi:MAG: hypothetical protein ACN4GZ_19745, partial [Acidimicrobiales bacterium]